MEKAPEIPPSIEEKKQPEVYFSVANLVRHLRVRKNDGTEDDYIVAVRGKDTKDGVKRYQALGGGAKISKEYISKMVRGFKGKIRFRGGEEADDARFYLPIPKDALLNPDDLEEISQEEQKRVQQNYNKWVSEVLENFTRYATSRDEDDVEISPGKDDVQGYSYEVDISREFMEDLNKADISVGREKIVTHYKGTVSPIKWKEKSSERVENAVGYERIFNLFDIEIPEELFNKIKSSDKFKILSKEEIEVINKETERGESLVALPDGCYIAENIFP